MRGMILSAFMAVLSLTLSIRVALIARVSSFSFALAEPSCVGMDNELLHAHLVVKQAKYHQYHQLTYTEEDSNYG